MSNKALTASLNRLSTAIEHLATALGDRSTGRVALPEAPTEANSGDKRSLLTFIHEAFAKGSLPQGFVNRCVAFAEFYASDDPPRHERWTFDELERQINKRTIKTVGDMIAVFKCPAVVREKAWMRLSFIRRAPNAGLVTLVHLRNAFVKEGLLPE